MWMKKHVLVKKMFINRLNMILPLRAGIEKIVYGNTLTILYKNSKCNKECCVNSVLDIKQPITVDLLGKGTTVNSVSYCQLLGKYLTQSAIHQRHLCRGLGPLPLKKTVLHMTLNYLMMRLKSWSFGECREPLQYHYSLVHFDPEWYYLLGFYLSVIGLFDHLPMCKQMIDINLKPFNS